MVWALGEPSVELSRGSQHSEGRDQTGVSQAGFGLGRSNQEAPAAESRNPVLGVTEMSKGDKLGPRGATQASRA